MYEAAVTFVGTGMSKVFDFCFCSLLLPEELSIGPRLLYFTGF